MRGLKDKISDSETKIDDIFLPAIERIEDAIEILSDDQ